MALRLNPASADPDEIAGYDYGEEERPRRGLLRALFVVLVMVLFGGGLWVAYQAGRGHAPREVPLIRADLGVTKARPEEPGGMAIPNQRMYIYGQGQGQTEKLLPPPETPLPRPAPTGAPAPEPPPTPAAVEAAPPPPAQPVAEPPAPPVAAAPQPSPPVAAPAVAPAAEPTPAALPPASASPAPASAGSGYRLQLASMRSAEDAKREWEKLRQANNDLLGNLAAAWPRADLGQRGTFYRVQAGPIADAAAAERICGELKRRNLGCILVRP